MDFVVWSASVDWDVLSDWMFSGVSVDQWLFVFQRSE